MAWACKFYYNSNNGLEYASDIIEMNLISVINVTVKLLVQKIYLCCRTENTQMQELEAINTFENLHIRRSRSIFL
jgi:hypothetical protein